MKDLIKEVTLEILSRKDVKELSMEDRLMVLQIVEDVIWMIKHPESEKEPIFNMH